jgi:hypothetical protein
MRPQYLIALLVVGFTTHPAFSAGPGSSAGQPMSMGPNFGVPGFNVPGSPGGYNPYNSAPYFNNPYGNPYMNPYGNPYASPYANPYTSPYYGYGNGLQGGHYGRSFFGVPQLVNGNTYSFNMGGAPVNFWRAPSGYYYPWMGGYSYTQYPIFIYNGQANGASQTLPPLSTIFSDLNDYLDKAKKDGKIDEIQYEHLKRRASDLLTKENSLAYEAGGTIDSGQESEIRRDVEGLSAEVARSVRP